MYKIFIMTRVRKGEECMRYLRACLVMIALGALPVSEGYPATIELADLALNLDGALYFLGDPLPVTVHDSGFNTTTGLGALSVLVRGAGAHVVRLFVDHEMDQAVNGFSNEFGAVQGIPASGQSWEIDRPGFPFGDIFTNVTSGQLDTSNGVPITMPDDVSLALGWDLTLQAGESALVTFVLGAGTAPPGFALIHTDTETQTTLAFTSTLTLETDTNPVPEPATGLLLGSGLLALAACRRLFRPRRG